MGEFAFKHIDPDVFRREPGLSTRSREVPRDLVDPGLEAFNRGFV